MRNRKAMEQSIHRVYEAGVRLLEVQSAKETYAAIVSEAIKLSRADYGVIFLGDGQELRPRYSTVPKGLWTISPRRRGFTYTAFRRGVLIVAEGKNLVRIHPEVRKKGVVKVLMLPLTFRGKTTGVINLLSKNNKSFNEENLSVLSLFGSMVSLRLRNLQLLQETQKALESRDLFISMAAHEIKTPLTTIHGYADMIRRRVAEGQLPSLEWSEELYAATGRLTRLVKELLQVDEIKSGELRFQVEEVSLSDIMDKAVKTFRFVFPERTVEYSNYLGDNPGMILADHDKLLQAIINVLTNAAKYSPVGTPIMIAIKDSQGKFVVSIKDQGLGISKEEQSKIFQKFYRGNRHGREGLGLGLFLVKNIVEEHNGIVEIVSQVNRGTTVNIYMPKSE